MAQRFPENGEHCRLALQAGRIGTWEWNLATCLLTSDPGYQSLFSLPPQIGPQSNKVYWAQMIPEEVAAGVEQAKTALNDGTEYQIEQRIIQRDGEVCWMLSRGRGMVGFSNRLIGVSLDITKHKRIEKTVRESEARLQSAVDLLGLGLYAWDPQTNALEWDARVKAMWGLPPDAQIDYGLWRDRVHPDDLARVEATVAACADPNGDGVYALEYRVNGVDGIERWVATHGRATFENGRAVGFLGGALDITERKQREARLHESEAQLSAILQQLPVGVVLVDQQGQFLLRGGLLGGLWDPMPSRDSRPARRWRSYDAQGQLVQPDHYPGERALRGETVLPGTDFIHTADDGRETWVRVSTAPFRSASGKIEGAVAILQDIDAEKRAEQTIRESEGRFREFAEHSSNALWILNADTRQFEYLSPAFDAIWQRPGRELRNHWAETIHTDDRERASDGVERALLGDLVVQEYRIVRSDGAVRSVRDIMFPIRDQHGRVKWLGGIAEDISVHDGLQAYVIDADSAARQKLTQVLHGAGYSVKVFASGADFIEMAHVLSIGCVVLNAQSSPPDGLELLRRLKVNGNNLPVIVIGASNGDVALAVQAMKAGAVDWLEIPYEDAALLMAVSSAMADIRRSAEQSRDAEFARARIAGMSARERQVLEGLLAGGTNKVIGRELGISPRTVELYRASVMERLGVSTLPEAVLMAAAAGVRPSPHPSRKPKSGR
jgi:PAS domain S-box-containing protein